MSDELVVGDEEDPAELDASGAEPSPPDERDFQLTDVLPEPEKVPLATRHEPETRWPMYRQGNKPHCVAATGAQLITISTFRQRGVMATFRFRDLYASCREIDGLPRNAVGTTARACLKVLRDDGALLDKPADVGGRSRLKIDKFSRVRGRREIKVAVKESGGALIITKWFRNWNTAGVPDSGILPKPKEHYIDHAWTVIGWDDDKVTHAGKGAFLMRNSLGKRWGKEGNGWLPYELLPGVLKEAWQVVIPARPASVKPQAGSSSAAEATGAVTQEESPVKLLLNVVPGQLGSVEPNTPVFRPDTLAEVTKIAATDDAKLVGRTEDGRFRGIIVESRHLPGGTAQKPVTGLLLVEAQRVSNIRDGV